MLRQRAHLESEFTFLPDLPAHTARHAPGSRFDVIPLLAHGIGPALRGGQFDPAPGYFPENDAMRRAGIVPIAG